MTYVKTTSIIWLSVVCVPTLVLRADEPNSPPVLPQPEEQVRIAADQVAQSGSGSHAAGNVLRDLPSNIVIQAIVERLRDGKGLSPRSRARFYELLTHHRAAQSDVGFEQLLEGVAAPESRPYALRGLGAAPPDKHRRVLERLTALVDDQQLPASDRLNAVHTLSRLGETAKPLLPSFRRLLLDDAADPRLRYIACYAVLRVGGVQEIVNGLADLDGDGQRAALQALVQFAGETEGTYNAPSELRGQIHDFVLDQAQSSAVETRKLSLEGLGILFGRDLVVNNAFNPEVFALLTRMAKADPNPEIRTGARRILDSEPEIINRVLRRTSSQPATSPS